jgi:hypothetical protein
MITPERGVNGKPAMPAMEKAVDLGKSWPAFSLFSLYG